jgi:hypothetical protein
MAIPVLSDFSFIETGKVRFEGVIEPATTTDIFIDNIPNSKMVIPEDVVRELSSRTYLYNDTTNELIASSKQTFALFYRNGADETMSGFGITDNMFAWNVDYNTLSFFPNTQWNPATGELYLNILDTDNEFTYDLRLIVDVEYYDYPI